MTAQTAETERTAVARPLRELVPLIKQEIDAGNRAGLEHYRRAGELLLEAKEQMAHGEFTPWLKRTFQVNKEQARIWMNLAQTEKNGAPRFSSLSDFVRKTSNPNYNRPSPLHHSVHQITQRVNVEHLARERQNQQREREMMRKLAMQLIDIGYKVLANKLHPDKGGSPEAMARLNKVRNILKGSI